MKICVQRKLEARKQRYCSTEIAIMKSKIVT